MKIVFMGTPQFAVPSLEMLIHEKYDIQAVITQPDRKKGRGQKVLPSPVKEVAMRNGIKVLQFDRIKSPEGVSALKDLAPDIIITAAFGQILSKEIIELPPLGCLNVHASLLPGYRGAAPIQWAIINGENMTGVTIMYMDEKLDTGDIISSVKVDISENMTGGELYEILSLEGARLLSRTLKEIKSGKAQRHKQDESKSSYYPPLSTETGRIDWNKSAREIRNLVRALDPVTGAYAQAGNIKYKIWGADVKEGSARPGKIVKADPISGLVVGTGSGLLRVTCIQAAGSKRMSAEDFLRGRKIAGDAFD